MAAIGPTSPELNLRRARWFGLCLSALCAATAFVSSPPRAVMLAIAVWSAVLWIVYTQRPRYVALRAGRSLVLRGSIAHRWILPIWGPGPLVAFAVRVAGEAGGARGVVAWILAGVATALALASLSEANARFVVDLDGITLSRAAFRSARHLRWAEMIGIRQAEFRGIYRFVLVGRGGAKIQVPQHYDGIGDFAALALRQVPAKILDAQSGLRPRLVRLAEQVGDGADRDPATI